MPKALGAAARPASRAIKDVRRAIRFMGSSEQISRGEVARILPGDLAPGLGDTLPQACITNVRRPGVHRDEERGMQIRQWTPARLGLIAIAAAALWTGLPGTATAKVPVKFATMNGFPSPGT